MALIIKRKFTAADIKRFVTLQVSKVEDIIFDQLQQIGEQFIIDARSLNTYKDITGNLRASIGYAISKNGKIVGQNYEGGTTEGRKNARTTSKEFVKLAPQGYALIVVAGMFYAGYVEAKGYDVITGPSITAGKNLKKAIAKVQKALNKQVKR